MYPCRCFLSIFIMRECQLHVNLLFVCFSRATVFCWWELGLGLGTYSEVYEEKGVFNPEGQSVVSLHTLMRLWGWRGDWWPRVAGTSVWLDPLGGRREDEDGELKAPQLCKCRSSWACFLVIFCDCVINCVKDMSKTNILNVIQLWYIQLLY